MRALALTLAFLAFLTANTAHAGGPYDTLAKGGAGGWLNVTRPITADDMQGRIVLLDFWTYGCINCMQIVPDLTALEEAFGDRLLIIGVHSAKFEGEQGSDRILAAAKRFGLKHPVINDSDFAIWKDYKVRAWPTLVVLGPDGTEASRYEGEGHRQQIEADIKNLKDKTTAKQTTIASLVDHKAAGGILAFPARLALGADGTLYVADTGHNRIAAFDKTGKEVLSIDGFKSPRGITLVGNTLYIANTGHHTVDAIDLQTKTSTTVAGTGQQGRARNTTNAPALSTPIASPWDVEALPDGRIAIAMAGDHQIWAYDPARKTLATIAGSGLEDIADGAAAQAALAQTSGLAASADALYFVDAESSSLRVLKNGVVKTLIGTGLFDFGLKDGSYPEAMLQHPQGLNVSGDMVYVADTYNNALRVYNLKTARLETLPLKGGLLKEPGDVIMAQGRLLVADTNAHTITSIDLKTGKVTTLDLHK